MISFGVALEVKGTAKGVWCYCPAPADSQRAAYIGMDMTWEEWSAPIIQYLDQKHAELSIAAKLLPPGQCAMEFSKALNRAIMMLSYQAGRYMTLPGPEYKALKEWVYQYLFAGRGSFPFTGHIPDGGYSFTIDFAKDTDIVRAYDLKTEMAQYNQDNNAAHNKKLGYQQTKKRFETIQGDEWTTQELLAQNISRKTLDTFVRHGLIRRDRWGHYVRNFV